VLQLTATVETIMPAPITLQLSKFEQIEILERDGFVMKGGSNLKDEYCMNVILS